MKFKLTTIVLVISGFITYAQQIGDGHAPATIADFSAPLKSGIYNGLNTTTSGMAPDNSNVWQHLFAARHISTINNYQLQIASSFAINDRLFFRKIVAGDLSSTNTNWVELATRGLNTFNGNQIINGNVGIGISVPSSTLEVKTPAIAGSETLLKLSVSDANQDYIRISNGTNTDNQFMPTIQGYRISDSRSILYLTATTESNMDIGTDPLMTFDSRTAAASIITRPLFAWDSYGNRKMILTSNGSLGIGTLTTGTHKLAVEGSIGAREIKVQATGWSDFVFKKEYNLPTLEEVEKHIAEKGHLKDIPNEEEVLKNGINLGEMNSKLLQKIEELTLYSIQQNKKIEDQAKEIEALKTLVLRIEKIEKELGQK
ncbi:hypothetical protein SAMN05444671_3843 [Flavobacterium sp. CF108]|uniref:hypothetical protein n=1 Tax=unclassified Flavobacterium TaxID=196869 RepID=UPI0008D5EA0A|nr:MULTISPECIES: hypothetical protein [unclassified Flavobacterium]SEO97133.1 hypothetical protein SAMN04487978_4128 [Flavobacterium sp. fv08]SHH80872.1 hypothetical protein SAMN05444671_3843 [Flavobacterium sp. CF108]